MTAKSMTVSFRIARPPGAVFDALTDAEQVTQWLATEAVVQAREGGAYHLTSGTPFCSGSHTVRRVDGPHALELDWVLEGCITTVGFALTPEGDGTRVKITHGFPPDTPFETDDEFGGEAGIFMEMWAYNAGLLKTLLELGEAKCRLDPDRAPSPAITHVMTLRAASADVFAALVDPEKIGQWNAYAKGAEVDARVGGRYSWGWKSEAKRTDGPDEIVEYEDGRTITFSWHGDPRTLVSWTVEPLPDAPNATKLTLVHSGFIKDQNMLVGYNLGWPGFLHALALWLEHGSAPDWMEWS